MRLCFERSVPIVSLIPLDVPTGCLAQRMEAVAVGGLTTQRQESLRGR